MSASDATPERSSRLVRIDIRRHWARIWPACEAILAAELGVPSRTWKLGGSAGYEMSFCRDSYVEFGQGEAFILAGLVPRVAALLRRHGYQVQVTDETRWDALQEPDCELLQSDLSQSQRQFLQAVPKSPRGVVVVQNERDIPSYIALLCTYLPRARTFICVANKEQLGSLKRRMKRHTNRPIETRSPEVWTMKDRLFIGTSQLFSVFNEISSDDWDMMLFADGESALREIAIKCCPLMQYQCRYCFLPASRRLSRREQLRLEHNVGPEIFREPSRLNHFRQPQIALVNCKQVTKRKSASGLEAKRRLWDDRGRNQLIAGLAKAFAQRDLGQLSRLGLVSPESVLQGLPAETPLNVSILVESVEHGRTLLPYLPGWSFEHQAPQTEPDDQAEGVWHVSVYDTTICTMLHAQRVGFGSDVVIRADADAEWPLRESCFGRVGPYENSSVLIVDLLDRADNGRLLERKLNCYQRLGWNVIGRRRIVRLQAH